MGCNTWPCFPSGSGSTMVVLKIPSQSTRLYTPLQLLCRTSSSAWWRGSNCRRGACPPPSPRCWASLSSLRRTGCGRRLGRAAHPGCPPSPAKGSSTHLLAAFLLTWVARRPLPKQRRVVRRRARAPAGRNLVTRRRRRTRTRPQLRGTLVPTCSEWSRAAYPTTHLQQQLGLVQSGLSSLTINSK